MSAAFRDKGIASAKKEHEKTIAAIIEEHQKQVKSLQK